MSDTVRVTKIEFENVGGIKGHMSLTPSPITIIWGRNGAGKSSIVNAFRRLFMGGYDPDLVTVGCDKATIKAEFSDGCYAIRTLNATARKSTIVVYSESGEEVRPPQETIEGYAAGFAFDPLKILTANKRDRLEYIEEMLDVKVYAEEIMEACQESDFLRLFDPKASAFTNIDAIAKSAYEQRTKINQKKEDLQGAVQTIRDGVMPLNAEAVDWDGAERLAREVYEAAAATLRLEVQGVNDAAEAARQREQYKLTAAQKEIEAEYKAALAAAEQHKNTRNAEVAAKASRNNEIIGATAAAELKATHERHDEPIAQLRDHYEAAKAALAAWNKATGAREQIMKLEKEIAEKAGRALVLTNVLDRLKLLRYEKQKSNPVPGLEIKDGEIWYHGLRFDAVNTGKRYELCIQLAIMRSGKCPLIVVDDMINIDDDRWRGFIAAAKGSGFQIVAARLDTGALRIEAIEEVAV